TARPPGPRMPARIVLSSKPELPAGCQLLKTISDAPVIVAFSSPSPPGFAAGEGWGERGGGRARPAPPPSPCPLPPQSRGERGEEFLALTAANGRPSVAALLQELGRRRMTNVLVEGGAAVFGSFLAAGLVDEFHVFVAPKMFGGGIS